MKSKNRLYPFVFLFFAVCAPQSHASIPRTGTTIHTDSGEVLLKKGTEVTLILEETVSSKMAQMSGVIGLGVYLDVKVDGFVVINSGRYGEGHSKVRRSGIFGRPGKVTVQATSVQAVDGQIIPLECQPIVGTGRDRYALAIVGSILLPAVGVILGPANPWAWWLTAGIGFGFLTKGRDVELNPVDNTKIKAFVKRDVWVHI